MTATTMKNETTILKLRHKYLLCPHLMPDSGVINDTIFINYIRRKYINYPPNGLLQTCISRKRNLIPIRNQYDNFVDIPGKLTEKLIVSFTPHIAQNVKNIKKLFIIDINNIIFYLVYSINLEESHNNFQQYEFSIERTDNQTIQPNCKKCKHKLACLDG